MKVDYRTDIGAIRESNQDACECGLFSENAAWAVVCDGMGGVNGGNVASAIALQTIRDQLIAGYAEGMSPGNLKSLLLNAVSRANDAVFEMSQERDDLRGMGTTAVVLVATGDALHVAHVGDSRAYRKTADGLEQITMDHSFVQDLVNLGQITPEEARVHPKRNIITRALGVHGLVQCDYDCLPFGPGDLALACSDGLSNYADTEQIGGFVEKHGQDGKGLVDDLIQFALEEGGADNITVAVINHA